MQHNRQHHMADLISYLSSTFNETKYYIYHTFRRLYKSENIKKKNTKNKALLNI